MALIKPFKAVHYDRARVGDLSSVVTRPYDVIDGRERERLLARHPNNFIRLILGKAPDRGVHSDDEYASAGALLKEWMSNGLFKRNESDCFYVYEQTFSNKDGRRLTRRGLFCTVLLQEFGKGDVYPHEETLSAPKEDRLRLMRSTRANLGSVFMLFADRKAEAKTLFERLSRGQADFEFTDEFGVTHRVVSVCRTEHISRICKLLKDEKLFIADGHHRYETAINYRDERMKAAGEDCPEGVNYVLSMCVPMTDEGLVIWPTHRLVKGISDFDADHFLKRCARAFEINPEGNPPGSADELLSRMSALRERCTFGVYTREKGFSLLVLKDGKFRDEVEVEDDVLKSLDVTILHKLIIEGILGVSQVDKDRIDYTPDDKAVVTLVDASKFQVGLFLNSTPLEKLKDVALKNQKMPPKSTFFYPKLSSGLIFNLLD